MKKNNDMKNYIDFKIDKSMNDYFNGDITTNELFESLDSIRYTNEGILDKVTGFLNKAKDFSIDVVIKVYLWILKTFDVEIDGIENLFSFFKKIGGKILSAFTWIINKIKDFKEKYPILFKVIIITAIIIFLLIITASSAAAATTGQKVSLQELGVTEETLNVMLGYMKDYNEFSHHGAGSFDTEQFARLIDVRDGVIDGPWDLGSTKILISDLKSHLGSLLDTSDNFEIQKGIWNSLKEVGEKFTNFSYESFSYVSKTGSGSHESLTIWVKKPEVQEAIQKSIKKVAEDPAILKEIEKTGALQDSNTWISKVVNGEQNISVMSPETRAKIANSISNATEGMGQEAKRIFSEIGKKIKG